MWVLIIFNLVNGTMISVPGFSDRSHCDQIGQHLMTSSDIKTFNLKYECFKTTSQPLPYQSRRSPSGR